MAPRGKIAKPVRRGEDAPIGRVTTEEIPRRKMMFLAEMRASGVSAAACEAAFISKDAAYRWRKEDPEFAAAWKDARAHAIGMLEKAAYNRAFYGWEEEVYSEGAKVGTKRRHSDALMMFMLRANRAKYRETSTINQKFSGQIATQVRACDLSDDELAEVVKRGKAKPKDGDD